MPVPAREQVRIGERIVTVSNLDRVLYPATGTTKAEVLRYYLDVADAILPHLAGRGVTLRRFPDGADHEGFFQKRRPEHAPDWLPTVTMGAASGRTVIDHGELAEPAALAWAANLAALELHTPLGRRPDVTVPTTVVFDLDPGAPAGLLDCAWLARELRTTLHQLGLEAYPKTSGGKGLQVYVPLNDPAASFPASRSFAGAIAKVLEQRHPERIVTTQTKTARTGRVLIDWTQNHPIKTTVCVYSLRARERPTASVPLTWDEVDAADRTGDEDPLRITFDAVTERLDRLGDLFAPVLTQQQQLPALG
jgi:bifunctional non-homologous end joining protein LigD